VTADPGTVAAAEGLILPGVGAFADAMAALTRAGLTGPIIRAAEAGTPLLGICLGMQLLFDRGTEFGESAGLGLIPGSVERLPEGNGGPEETRIPNVGWRRLEANGVPGRDDPLTAAIAPGAMFYFVHSYVPAPADPADVLATIPVNGRGAAVMVRRANVAGCQFHPEKSAAAGLALLQGFLDWVEGAKALRRSA
jgi:glutamine amidotransferase